MRFFYRRIMIVLPGVLVLFLCCGCATNPATQRTEFVLMSEQQEIETGRQLSPEIRKTYGVYDSDRLQQYVDSVGQRLCLQSHRPGLDYRFTVLDSPLVNAFALPGGYIFITRGLMAHMNSEAELAGVLAHEIGHVTARHSVRQYTQAATYQIGAGLASVFVPELSRFGDFANVVFAAVSSGYSRAFETEADSLALTYAEAAGYDRCAMASMLSTLNLLDRYSGHEKTHTGLFATHPETEKRISDVNQSSLCPDPYVAAGGEDRIKYLKQIDGLVFGDDPREGIVSENRFIHPILRCALTFPPGWKVQNRPDAVIGADEKQEAFVEFNLLELPGRCTASEAAEIVSKKLNLRWISGSPEVISGLKAYTGTWSARNGEVGVRLGCFMDQDRLFYVLGFARADDFEKNIGLFDRTIRSFRKLSAGEAENVKPDRIVLHRVKKGETLSKILKLLGRPESELKTVSLINAWDPEKLPLLVPGMMIKVIH